MCDFERGMNSYLRGEWADHGWWYYYLYALAIKMPLGIWCLAVLALVMGTCAREYSASSRDEMVIVVPCVIILICVSSQTGFSAHSRYIIPALPFLFIWTSKVAQVFEMRPFDRKRLVVAAIAAVSLIWAVGSSLVVYPHSLSYFNELAAVLPTNANISYLKGVHKGHDTDGILSQIKHLLTAGPRNGPRHLLNSNIDWSQDLLYLRDWLDEHPGVRLNGLDCFGCCPTTLAGIPNHITASHIWTVRRRR